MVQNDETEEEREPELPDRLRGMIWGQFVGDAASLGTHWIYNLNDMAGAYPEGIRGFEAPKEGHYHYGKKPGDFTHYGDAALIMLESVAESGRFYEEDFGSRFVAAMDSQAYTGYMDHATRETLESKREFEEKHPGEPFDYQRGADDDQLATVTSLAPVVAAHHREEGLLDLVERATRVRQNSDRAVAYVKTHALILLKLLEGRDIHSVLHRVEEIVSKDADYGFALKRKIQTAFDHLSKSVENATDKLGQSCPLPSSFPSSVHALLKFDGSFEEAVLRVIRAGGDNAGRAGMVGAWLGAHLGIDAIPGSWRDRLKERERIEGWVEKIVGRGEGATNE